MNQLGGLDVVQCDLIAMFHTPTICRFSKIDDCFFFVIADNRTRIIDLMNTLNWNKLDQRWKETPPSSYNLTPPSYIFFFKIKHSLQFKMLDGKCSMFYLPIILIMWGVSVLMLWFLHLKNNSLKEYFSKGQASYGSLPIDIRYYYNQWTYIIL